MLKLFPELGGEDVVSLEQLLQKCQQENKKMHESILNFEHQLHVNKKLMDLHEPNIPEEALEEINNLILNPNRELNSQEFIKLYHEDELGNSINNLQAWLFNNFNHLKFIK